MRQSIAMYVKCKLHVSGQDLFQSQNDLLKPVSHSCFAKIGKFENDETYGLLRAVRFTLLKTVMSK